MGFLYEMYKDVIHELCLDAFSKNMVRDLLYIFYLQGFIKHINFGHKTIIARWHNLILDKDSNEYKQSLFAIRQSPLILDDIMLTLRYFPEYCRLILKKVKYQICH